MWRVMVLSSMVAMQAGPWGLPAPGQPPRIPDTPNASLLRPADHRDNGFTFCTLAFSRDRYEESGNGWNTDFPLAGQNFMLRLPEITYVRTVEPEPDKPQQWVVSVESDELYLCPLVLVSDGGTMHLQIEDARRLGRYLQKGGIVWFDDSWGTLAWSQILREIGKVAPESWRIETPTMEHPLFHMLHHIAETVQVSHVGFWATSGKTAERGEESPVTPLRVLLDDQDRVVVVITHNTDWGDTWERESHPAFFEAFAAQGYGMGINVLLYAMTH